MAHWDQVGPSKIQFNYTRVRTPDCENLCVLFYLCLTYVLPNTLFVSVQISRTYYRTKYFRAKLGHPATGPTVNEAWLLLKWLKISFYSLRWKKFLAPLLHFRLILSHSLFLFLFLSLSLLAALFHTRTLTLTITHTLSEVPEIISIFETFSCFFELYQFSGISESKAESCSGFC